MMSRPTATVAGRRSVLRLRAVYWLAFGLVLSLGACDRSSESEQDAEARELAELKARLDSLAEESGRALEEIRQAEEHLLQQQQDRAVGELAGLLSEADAAGSGAGIGDSWPTGQGPRSPLGEFDLRHGKPVWQQGASVGRIGDHPLATPGVVMASHDVLGRVKAAVTQLGGRIDTSSPDTVIYHLSNPHAPWTATYKDGSLTLSQKLTGVPDDPAVRKAINDFINSPRHASTIRYTYSFEPNGSKLWYLEVARVLPQAEVVRSNGISDHVAGGAKDHKAMMDYVSPMVKKKPAATSRASIGDREPTEAEMLEAMRNHPAAQAGRSMFTLTGVRKVACKRVSAYQYRCVYVPQMSAEGDSATSWLIGLTPRGENIGTFTYAGGRWQFSGAE